LFRFNPTIAYSIDAATESEIFDRVIASIDDEEIAEIATSFGPDVPEDEMKHCQGAGHDVYA
jgi:pseudaminic acid cytidylyltransferase